MSIDIDWEAATSGPDGAALSERIRSFIHDKFQQIALPRFIRSVEVNSFDFGTIGPELQIRDLCDPFDDFYEEDEDDIEDVEHPATHNESPKSLSSTHGHGGANAWETDNPDYFNGRLRQRSGMDAHDIPLPSREDATTSRQIRSPMPLGEPLNSYFFPRAGTPGIPGGTSNLGYYMPLGGLSGAQTPLASVTRGPFSPGLRESSVFGDFPNSQGRHLSNAARRQSDIDIDSGQSRPSTAGNSIQDRMSPHSSPSNASHLDSNAHGEHSFQPRRLREKKPEDLQVLCRVKYSGNIHLSLTAQVLLDYPMPNFVGLPLKLNITGLTFDGVAVIAYMGKRVHFCFLSPEDADTLVGVDENETSHMQSRETNDGGHSLSARRRDDSLLRDVRVESEIGRKEDGKQVLKNVGKVEKFVLEQVRRIFEEELVYPSFWTFLI